MADHPFDPRCAGPEGLVRPVPLDPTGRHGPTRNQARSRRWVRVGPNAYVPSGTDRSSVEQRILEKSTQLGRDGAVTGWGSLRLHGAAYFDGLLGDGRTQLPVLLAVGGSSGRRTHAGTALAYEPLPDAERCVLHGIAATTALRALFDEMRRTRDWREAVVAMDMAAAAELVSTRRMERYLTGHRSWRRSTVVEQALPFCSEWSRSPAESRLRLVWEVDAGLPRPLVNRDVFDRSGRRICVADLFDPDAGLVVEYDGAAHRTALRHSRDVAREERCRAVGLEYCKVTGMDMRSVERVVDRLAATRGRARFAPEPVRRWTLDAPPGWHVPESLDARLDRREWIADRMEAEHGIRPTRW